MGSHDQRSDDLHVGSDAERRLHDAERRLHDAERRLHDAERRLHDAEQRLHDAERSLAETQRLAGLGSWTWDVTTGALAWSDELYRLYGLTPQEFEATFEAAVALTHPDDLQMLEQATEAVYDGSAKAVELDYRIVRPDGQVLWLRARGSVVRDEQGNAVRLFGTAQDITAIREAEQQLREQRDEMAVLAAVMQATDEAVIVTAPDGTILRWNPGAERLYGYTAEEAVGQHVTFMLPAEITAQLPDMFAEVTARGHLRTDSAGIRKDGTKVLTSVTLSQIGPIGGLVSARVAIARDVTEQKRGEERERAHARQLARLAFHDPLTGLANRALLHDRLGQALSRRDQHRSDVLLLDLDDFKTVNDVSGHAAGDQLLVEVARRLLACVRPQDTVARLGGDEFAILLEDSDGDAVAPRVQQALSKPVIIEGREVVPRASVGIGCNDGTQDPDQVMLRADVAMYAAKAEGKGRTKTFSADMASAVRDRADLEAALRQAVPRGEIVVHYLPIIDVNAGLVSRVEALVRWQRPHGLVPPWQFLALAESTGVIQEIGAEVLRQALTTLRSWLADDERRSVAANVSAVQLADGGFADEVLEALSTNDTRPEQLVLEVTESLFMEPEPQLIDQLAALRERGVRVSIDDFGTGYSSLGRLQTLPVDSIKIDKSFVDDLQTGHEDLPILTSMIVMAHNLGLDVTAEGVETAHQAERLVALGCDHLQGYHFARPMPAGELPGANDAADEAIRRLGFKTGDGVAGQPEVVVIEDDRVTRLLISTTLASEGWRVQEAATVEEGDRLACAAARVDCIVVDLNLPDGDGIDLVAALRTRPHLAATPIVVLTGTADRGTKARAFSAGADDYIVKPISAPQLAVRLRVAMRAESSPHPG